MAHHPHPLATLDQVISTPSSHDGVPKEVEEDLRTAGCMLIQQAGIMLGLPQSTMTTAQVIFHRFYFVSSLYSFGVNDISISALFLSSKLCETPIRLRDLINTYLYLLARIDHLLQLPSDQPLSTALNDGSTASSSATRLPLNVPDGGGWQLGDAQRAVTAAVSAKGKEKALDPLWSDFKFDIPGFHDPVFWDWKDTIVSSEMQILKRLGFNMQVDLPYSHMINYLKILDLVFEDEVPQMCWSILNDALLTRLYAIHPPHTLACASILLATRLLRIPLPEGWYILFDVEYEDIWSCCGQIMILWRDWDIGRGDRVRVNGSETEGGRDLRKEKENRWRRAWILSQSRKAVRRWLEEKEKAVA